MLFVPVSSNVESTWSGWISIEMFFITTQLYLQKAEMQLLRGVEETVQ